MYNRAYFGKRFGTERVNESQNLLKSAEKHLYPAFSSFWAKLSSKKSFLIRSEMIGPLDNAFTASYDYCRSNREHLPLPIEIN